MRTQVDEALTESEGDLEQRLADLVSSPEGLKLTQQQLADQLGVSQSTISRMLQRRVKTERRKTDLLSRVESVRNTIPLPVYCTHLNSGSFVFVNNALAQFLNYELATFTRQDFSAESLYANAAQRRRWVRSLYENLGTPVSMHVEYLCGATSDNHESPSIHVIDTAILVVDGSEHFALGVLGHPPEWEDLILSAHRLAACRDILDLIDVGVHEIDEDGRLVYMNLAERRMLDVSDDWLDERPHVAELSPAEHVARRSRVALKLHEGVNLTKGEPRSFRKRPQEPINSEGRDTLELVPVNITDIPIAEPSRQKHGRQNRGIFTIVEDPRVSPGIKQCLLDFGPRNPLLESIGVATFEATTPEYASTLGIERDAPQVVSDEDLVFVYGNRNFINEVRKLSRRFPSVGVQNAQDILGKTQAQLWNVQGEKSDYGTIYAAVDQSVMSSGRIDERVESHLCSSGGGSTWMQVVKFPHYSRSNPSEIVGVEGFYWEVGGKSVKDVQESLVNRMKVMYRPFDILDNVPLPIYAKDVSLRFVYANQAYIEDLRSLGDSLKEKVNGIRDIIGRRDRDIFPEELAEEYESDDSAIITQRESEIKKVEQHGKFQVKVFKKPVFVGANIVGVQGVFYRVDEP